MAYLTSCVILPPQFGLYMQVGCTADCSIVCRLAKEPSVCHSRPCFLFTFGVVHQERFEVGSQKFQRGSSRLPSCLECSICHKVLYKFKFWPNNGRLQFIQRGTWICEPNFMTIVVETFQSGPKWWTAQEPAKNTDMFLRSCWRPKQSWKQSEYLLGGENTISNVC